MLHSKGALIDSYVSYATVHPNRIKQNEATAQV